MPAIFKQRDRFCNGLIIDSLEVNRSLDIENIWYLRANGYFCADFGILYPLNSLTITYKIRLCQAKNTQHF